MGTGKTAAGTQRAIFRASAILNNIGVTVALLYIMLTVCSVFARLFFNIAIPGTHELVCWGLLVVGMFSLAQTQVEKVNITIDFATGLLPRKFLAYSEAILYSVAVVVYGMLCWRMLAFGLAMKATGTYSSELRLPEWIIPVIGAVGVALFTVVLMVDIARFIAEIRSKE